jgi:hypothetical protein
MVLHTGDLQLTLTALMGWAEHHELRLQNLLAQPPSLEEAFLAVAESGDDPPDGYGGPTMGGHGGPAGDGIRFGVAA